MKYIEGILSFIFVVLIAVILAVLISGAFTPDPPGVEKVTTENGFHYERLVIDGMPCIYVEETRGYSGYAGLTCDWAKNRPVLSTQ